MSFKSVSAQMLRKRFIWDFLFKVIVLLQLLSCKSEGSFVNNQTLIKIINTLNTSWIAGKNEMDIPDTFDSRESENSSVPTLPSVHVRTPGTFDARSHWKNCRVVIDRIRSQGKCGSCWAVSAASVLSDRTCIETKGGKRVHLSAEDITTCCPYCKKKKFSCAGGQPSAAIYFWTKAGLVTGGELDSEEGCKPYSRRSFRRKHSRCRETCSNKYHWKEFDEDKYQGRMVYYVKPDEESIKGEILTRGPVVSGMKAFEDLRQYKRGVYRHEVGEHCGYHAVRIIGWGMESDVKYWLVANSWGVKFGMKGYFKIVRGENHCRIEHMIVAGSMFDYFSEDKILREAATSSADERRKILLHVFIIWILIKETLKKLNYFV